MKNVTKELSYACGCVLLFSREWSRHKRDTEDERISQVVTLAKFNRNKSKLSLVNLMLHKTDDQELCSKALAALHAKALPLGRPVEVWGGKGSGDPCPVCGDDLKSSELEYELAFDTSEENPACVLHMHLRCFAAWETAKKSVMRKRGE